MTRHQLLLHDANTLQEFPMKSLHLLSRNTPDKGEKCAMEQHGLQNTNGKTALNSDMNMHLADWVKDSPHPGVSHLWHQSHPLLGAGPQLRKPRWR